MTALKRIQRADGRIEIICQHGIGHPTFASARRVAEFHGHEVDVWMVHGCDGCCKRYAECKER